MRRVCAFLLLLLLPACSQAQTQPAPQPRALTLIHVTVVSFTGAPAQPDMTVVIAGDRITALGKTGKLKPPRNAQVVDATGKFLIPGLCDMHVHLTMGGSSALPVFVANGVTCVRDMGGDIALVNDWRQQIAAGSLLGPRIKAAGPVLESPRFLQMLERIAGAVEPPFGELLKREISTRVGVPAASDAATIIASLKEQGADIIKFRTHASPEIFFALVKEARAAGLPLVGHEPAGVSLLEASDAGQRSIEHVFSSPALPKFSAEERAALGKRFVQNGTWLVPTLITNRTTRLTPDSEVAAIIDDTAGTRDPRRKYVSAGLVAYWRLHRFLDRFESPQDWKAIHANAVELLREMHRAGVGLLAGTDFGARIIFPGFSLHDELALLVEEIGMSPLAALQTATLHPAKFFGSQEMAGSIEKGKLADLVLLDADPLDDIRNTRKIHAVVLGGRYLPRSELDKLLASAQAAAGVRSSAHSDPGWLRSVTLTGR